jgi:hypothetical protein
VVEMPRRDAATVRLAPALLLRAKEVEQWGLVYSEAPRPRRREQEQAARPRAATPPRLPPLSRAAAPSPSACRAAPSTTPSPHTHTTHHHPSTPSPRHFLLLSHSNYCASFASSFSS